MIKKSLFEQDIISGMEQELRKRAAVEAPNLVKAGECLHAVLEILEEAGLQTQADQVLAILAKIASEHKRKPTQQLPAMHVLMQHGVTQKDIAEFYKGSPIAKAKVNFALYNMGLDGHAIARFLGPDNVMTKEEAKQISDPHRGFGKMWDWMQNPAAPMESGPVPGSTLKMEPLNVGPQAPLPSQLQDEQVEDASIPAELKFKSMASKHSHPDKIQDVHTKKLTPAKMVANLKHHGTEFNMPDLGWSDFDPELAEALGIKNTEEAQADQSADWDLGLSEDEWDVDLSDALQVNDPQPLEDFEDEVSK